MNDAVDQVELITKYYIDGSFLNLLFKLFRIFSKFCLINHDKDSYRILFQEKQKISKRIRVEQETCTTLTMDKYFARRINVNRNITTHLTN